MIVNAGSLRRTRTFALVNANTPTEEQEEQTKRSRRSRWSEVKTVMVYKMLDTMIFYATVCCG